MIRAGRHHTLRVLRRTERGALLANADGDQVLLPRAELPAECTEGDELEVFVHHDTEDRLVATRDKPLATVGSFAALVVVDRVSFGVFVDWGLGKDLLVPMGERGGQLEIGQRAVVYITLDEQTGRVIGSARLGPWFDEQPFHLKPRDRVSLLVFAHTDLGSQVVVDGRHRGIVYHNETYRNLEVGDALVGWVARVREDGRVDVLTRPPGRRGAEAAREQLLAALEDAEGFLPLHDRTPPERIARRLQLSKKRFKRAVGQLYKAGRIRLERGEGIYLIRE